MSRFNDPGAVGRHAKPPRCASYVALHCSVMCCVLGLLMSPAAHSAESASTVSIRGMAAAVEPVGGKARDPAIVSALPKPSRGRQTLRCWQEGKLVFESASVAPSAPSLVAIELRSAGRGDLAVQVFDLKQGLCVIEHGSEP